MLLDDLTWTELRARIAGGATTALLPVGGTEQSGPHMALGKHNVRVRLLAVRIAERLGNAVVAPVLAYVPEGAIEPPTQHMRYPGTISVPVPVFEATLEAGARSLCRAGFHDVFLLGDHGGYAASLERVAARLSRGSAAGARCRVQALGEYYRAAQEPYNQALAARGLDVGRDRQPCGRGRYLADAGAGSDAGAPGRGRRAAARRLPTAWPATRAAPVPNSVASASTTSSIPRWLRSAAAS